MFYKLQINFVTSFATLDEFRGSEQEVTKVVPLCIKWQKHGGIPVVLNRNRTCYGESKEV